MLALHWLAVTAVLLHFLAIGFAVRVSEDDARMPPGKSLGDHMCVHDKVTINAVVWNRKADCIQEL